jgi:hypothetical protein
MLFHDHNQSVYFAPNHVLPHAQGSRVKWQEPDRGHTDVIVGDDIITALEALHRGLRLPELVLLFQRRQGFVVIKERETPVVTSSISSKQSRELLRRFSEHIFQRHPAAPFAREDAGGTQEETETDSENEYVPDGEGGQRRMSYFAEMLEVAKNAAAQFEQQPKLKRTEVQLPRGRGSIKVSRQDLDLVRKFITARYCQGLSIFSSRTDTFISPLYAPPPLCLARATG